VDGDVSLEAFKGSNVLLIHSVITSRLVSSRESLYIVQDDHDRANGANSAPLVWYMYCVEVANVAQWNGLRAHNLQ